MLVTFWRYSLFLVYFVANYRPHLSQLISKSRKRHYSRSSRENCSLRGRRQKGRESGVKGASAEKKERVRHAHSRACFFRARSCYSLSIPFRRLPRRLWKCDRIQRHIPSSLLLGSAPPGERLPRRAFDENKLVQPSAPSLGGTAFTVYFCFFNSYVLP